MLARFITKMRAFYGEESRKARTQNCYPRGTRRERTLEAIETAKLNVLRCKQRIIYPLDMSLYEERLAEKEALLARIIEEGKAEDMDYAWGRPSNFLTVTPDGMIRSVYYNIAMNAIFYEDCVKHELVPLTNLEARFWYGKIGVGI